MDGIIRPFKTQTIIDLLNVSAREEDKLTTLICDKTKKGRKKKKDASRVIEKRREQGQKPRKYYLADMHMERTKNALKASQMLQEGFTKIAIAKHLKISRPTLNKMLNELLSGIGEEMKNQIKLVDYREGLQSIKDSSVNLLLTDPPYLLGLADWDAEFNFQEFISLITPKIKSGGTVLLFCSTYTLGSCIEEMKMNGFDIRRILIWEKTNPTPVKNSYSFALEHIVFAVKGKSNAVFNLPSHIPGHSGVFRYSSIEKGRYHFAQKPIALLCELIELHSNQGDMILDCFSGSGAISVAAKMLNRSSVAFEINEEYFMKSIERLNNV